MYPFLGKQDTLRNAARICFHICVLRLQICSRDDYDGIYGIVSAGLCCSLVVQPEVCVR